MNLTNSSKKHSLWVEKYRPITLDNYLGNESFLNDLQEWITKQDFPNLLLHGEPGTGKTTAAKLIIANISCDHIYMNCSDENGIDAIRDKVKHFASTASFKKLKVVVLDESDFLTTNAQAALRNIIETFSMHTRFIFTCNFTERIIPPLQSRLASYALTPPSPRQVYNKMTEILANENVVFVDKELAHLVKTFYPDIRKILNNIQACVKNNELNIKGKSFVKSDYIKEILSIMSSPSSDSFTKVRQIIADNSVRDFTELYKSLYDNTTEASKIITIAEGLHNSAISSDREITFMATIAKLL
jgi:DNA polymerase III delta prime subunit